MRRTWAVCAVTVVSVALCAGPALGQDASEPAPSPEPAAAPAAMEPAVVTGQEFCQEDFCEEKLSDPRVSGLGFVEWAGEAYVPGGNVFWGTFEIQGPDGSWTGPFVGTQIERTTAELLITLEGSEAYDGWAFVGMWTGPTTGAPMDVRGVIYEGSAPHVEWRE